MIIIKNLKVEKPFMYIWLKNVHNVKLNYHCAKCLIGNYHPKINKKTKSIKDLVLDNDIWYPCGVSLPYNWNNNFHLAFEYKDGATIEYSDNGISVCIENAKRLPISSEYINPSDPNYSKKEFFTCRNWQFAHYLKSNKF